MRLPRTRRGVLVRDSRRAPKAGSLAAHAQRSPRSDTACRGPSRRMAGASRAQRAPRIRTLLIEQSLAAMVRSDSDHGRAAYRVALRSVRSTTHTIAIGLSGVLHRCVGSCDSTCGLRQLGGSLSVRADSGFRHRSQRRALPLAFGPGPRAPKFGPAARANPARPRAAKDSFVGARGRADTRAGWVRRDESHGLCMSPSVRQSNLCPSRVHRGTSGALRGLFALAVLAEEE